MFCLKPENKTKPARPCVMRCLPPEPKNQFSHLEHKQLQSCGDFLTMSLLWLCGKFLAR